MGVRVPASFDNLDDIEKFMIEIFAFGFVGLAVASYVLNFFG